MTAFIKTMLALQGVSLLWMTYIALTAGDPGTALGWVFFQFLIMPFVFVAVVLAAARWLMQLGASPQ